MNTSKIEEILQNFYEISGMDIAILNSRNKILARRYSGALYCTCIHKSEICLDMCLASDKCGMTKARESGELVIYKCPFGIYEAIMPIRKNEDIIGYLFLGMGIEDNKESQKELLNDIKRVLKPGGVIYINDFLLNSGFKRWLFYKKAQKETGIYGAFKTYDGATVRHHAEDYILNLLSDFKTHDYQKFVIPTMNGNKSNSFGFIGELKK